MKSNNLSGDIIELDKRFSTTRRVIKSNRPSGNRQECNRSKNQLLLKRNERFGEGGLRTRGYYKAGEPGRPLISVVTVVYDGAAHIERAIQSVIGQSYDNVEYIIIDGGSTDGTLEIIRKFDDRLDYWLSEPDQGIYDAMNKGVRQSYGDYVLFLGCDDCLFDVLHETVGAFDRGATSYYGNVIQTKDGKIYGGRFYPLKLFVKNMPHQALFYSRRVFDDYTFDSKYFAVADYALNLMLYSNEKYGFKYIRKTVARYNNESGLSSTFDDHGFSIDKPSIIRDHYPVIYYRLYLLLRSIFSKNL